MATKSRPAQALVELAVGMVVVSLVLAAVFAFTNYILASLEASRSLRAEAGRNALSGSGSDGSYASASASTTLTLSPLAADHIFGSSEVTITEEVHLPLTNHSPIPG